MTAVSETVDSVNTYPLCLNGSGLPRHALQDLQVRLEGVSGKLFLRATPATVHVLQIPTGGHVETRTCGEPEEWQKFLADDLHCQMIFIGAKDSRSRLNITREMFLQLLSVQRVMPSFLEFVLSGYGQQHTRRDPHIGGFFSNSARGNELRNDKIEFCLTLQAPEPKVNSPDPWSVRQASIWHRFDLSDGRQSWIVIKANAVIKDAVEEQARSYQDRRAGDFDHISKSLELCLATLLEICSWSGRNWHWYLTSMEENVRSKTRRAVSGNLAELDTPAPRSDNIAASDVYSRHSTSASTAQVSQSLKWWSLPRRVQRTTEGPNDLEKCVEVDSQVDNQQEIRFSFASLQDALHQEETANSAIMVLKSNAETIQQLGLEYQWLVDNADTAIQIHAFNRKLAELASSFRVLQARAETFLQLVQDRKSLLYAILQAENMKQTFMVSKEAKDSAVRMERMTEYMHKLAVKTQTETVRVRIITVVTLFFLPGTFVSTLMSTDVVNFPGTDTPFKDIEIGHSALEVYVLLSIPLMLLTFFSWWMMHRGERPGTREGDRAADSKLV